MTMVSRLTWGVLYICMFYPTVYGVSYVGGLSTGFSGGDLLLFLFGLLWVGDTAAMGIGAWLGKHKLAPTVSPNKTIEGFIGGIVGAIAVGVLMYFWKLEGLGPRSRIGTCRRLLDIRSTWRSGGIDVETLGGDQRLFGHHSRPRRHARSF